MKIKQFEELEVWQLSRKLVKEIYLNSRSGELSKDFRFVGQIQSAGLSIMNNIAEGFERPIKRDFMRFLYIAKSSAGEVRSMLYLANDIKYINDKVFSDLMAQVILISKSLAGLIKYLNLTNNRP